MAVQVQGQTGGGAYIANVDSNGNLYVTLANSDIAGLPIVGGLTHNSAAPAAASQLGVLPAVASSGAPTYNAGDQVLLSTDLSGNLRTTFPTTPIVYIEGHSGVVLDAVLGATKPANVLQVGGNDGTNAYAVPLASGGGSVVVSGSVSGTGNFSVNIAQVLGSTHSKTNSVFSAISAQTNVITAAISAMGSAPTGTEVMMVNSTGFAYNGSTYNALTCNSTTITSKFALDQNLTAVLGATHAKTNSVFTAISDQTNVITAAISAIGVAPTGTEVMMVNATNFIYNGSSYVKQTGNSTTQSASADVNVVSVLGATHAKTNSLFTAISDQTNVITAAISAIGVAPTGTEVMMVNNTNFVYNGSSYVKQTANSTSTASAAAVDVNLTGVLGTAFTTAGVVNTTSYPSTAGGCSANVQQALTTTINIKGSAGQLYGYTISNPNNTPAYCEYYNTATTPGTIGSTTNLLLEIMIPAGGTANMEWSNGIAFSSGIAVAVATTATGNTAPGIGLTITTIYK